MNYSLNQLKRIQTIKKNLNTCFFEISSQDKKSQIQSLLDKIHNLENDLLGGHTPNFTKKEELMNKVLTSKSSSRRNNTTLKQPPNSLSDFRVFANMNLSHPDRIESKRRDLMIPKKDANLLIRNTIDNSPTAEISILVSRLTPMFQDKFKGKQFESDQQLRDEIMVELYKTQFVPRNLREQVADQITREYLKLQNFY
jgi:hypothetical protein